MTRNQEVSQPLRRLEMPESLLQSKIIAVLRAKHARDYDRVIATLVDEGIRSVELTLTTPGTIEHISSIRMIAGPDTEVGVGTIVSVEQAVQAIEAGADYLVTPTTDAAIINCAVYAGMRIYPGGLTPTELNHGWRRGATAVKLFPASTVGPGYISQLRGPFPDIRVVPSGGIGIENAAAWLRAGAAAVSVGGPLIGDAFNGGDLSELRERAKQLTSTVRSVNGRS